VQLRKQARERREYLFRKSVEDKEQTIQERKKRLKEALDGETPQYQAPDACGVCFQLAVVFGLHSCCLLWIPLQLGSPFPRTCVEMLLSSRS